MDGLSLDDESRTDDTGAARGIDDLISVGNIEGVGIAIGVGASVEIYGDVYYYPIKLRAPLREAFDPLLEDRTTLFAGREAALARIAEFIQDSAGGYLVITAPAGFGKTALTANLVAGTPEAFAYHFFTPTYVSDGLGEDFFLRNVVEQLAQWHGHEESLPERLHELSALYHKFIDEPLEHTQVLVLDGLDEVIAWKLDRYLSRRLPPNLHIILTVRDVGQDWATEYALPGDQIQHLPLGGLTRGEVAEILRMAGGGALAFADDPLLLEEVMRVSVYQADESLGADPFYVRLLAEDAADGQLTPENISEQPQGLDAYLDAWWQEIKGLAGEQSVKDLFGTLTVALAPIGRTDIEAINPSLADSWSEDFFDDVLNRVRRWVVGDAERGYALVHPRLRLYMHTRIKVETYCEKLLAYCADWKKHRSTYALKYYAKHLARAGQIDGLYTLVENQDWTSEKYIGTPWIDSLIQDLQLASALAVGEDIAGWTRAMAYQLHRALIENIMSRLSDGTIQFMAKLGRIDQALHFAKRRFWESFRIYHRIAEIVAESQPDRALGILMQSVHLFDRGSILNQYGARLVVAKKILENNQILAKVPTATQEAETLMRQAWRIESQIPQSDRLLYQAIYTCPILALTDQLDEAKVLAKSLPLHSSSQALRHISLVLPPEHSEKALLAEDALSILESADRNTETITREVEAIVTLLPDADEGRQAQFIERLISLERELHTIDETLYNPPWSRAVESIADFDLDRAKDILSSSEWTSSWRNTWPAFIRKIALHDPEEALSIAESQYSQHAGYSSVLADIIRAVAVQFRNIEWAEELIDKYSKPLSGPFGRISQAHLAIAEAYLAQGDIQKAEEVFDEQVFTVGDQGVRRGRNDLLVAMLGRFGALDLHNVEVISERLGGVGEGIHFSPQRLLGYLAARQDRVDFIETCGLGAKAQISAIGEVANRDIQLAKVLWDKWSFNWPADRREVRSALDAHIEAREAKENPAKIDEFLQCYDSKESVHDMCNKMVALPNALHLLLEQDGIAPDKAKAIIERTYPILANWECRRGESECRCYSRSERALALLISIMAKLDYDRARSMTESLPLRPIKVVALKSILLNAQFDENLVEEIIKLSQEMFESLDLARSYYDLAANVLPADKVDWIGRVIELADPLVDDNAWPQRPSPRLKTMRAKAWMRLVDHPDRFDYVEKAIASVGSFRDKLEFLGMLAEQAGEWPREQRFVLLRRVWELATTRQTDDVEALIAFSVPILESLADDKEEAFWKLYDYVEWAYQELPQLNVE